MRSPRFWFIVAAMLFTALALYVRGDVDHVPPSRPLSDFPTTVGDRNSVDIPIDPETLAILGKGEFLSRTYALPSGIPTANRGENAEIGLYIAYFPTQRTGQSIHSPQNCLPGAGWTMQSKGVTEFTDAAGKKYRVGDYLITNGGTTDEALYWYQLHGESIANDYKAKLLTLADSIRYDRTDEALVRIVTPVRSGENPVDAHIRAVTFAQEITPLLPTYVPN